MGSGLILTAANARDNSQLRMMNKQFAANRELQLASINHNGDPMELILQKAGLSRKMGVNQGLSPADAYREFDSTTKIEQVPAGEFALLSRVLNTSRSVNIGRTVYEYRKASDAHDGKTSLNGQNGIALDHVDYDYDGSIIPIHDAAFGRNWREYQSMTAEGFDSMVDDAREKERGLMNTANTYMWEGDASLVVKGKSWLGIKGDPSVVNVELNTNLVTGTPNEIYNEIRTQLDVLYITNNCTNPLDLVISREAMSYWQTPFTVQTGDGDGVDSRFGSILDMVRSLRGINSVMEDSYLTGSQMALLWINLQGFSSLIGQGLSTYAVPRLMHNSDFSFIKWMAAGFMVKTDFSGRTCALYGDDTV